MDIVQYLHGLVATNLGLGETDARADLLQQYYALSLARIVALDIAVSDENPKDTQTLWGNLTSELVKRLARSFHSDEQTVLALLDSATPLFITELVALAQENHSSPSQLISTHFFNSRLQLPAWSDKFITGAVLRHLSTDPNAVINPITPPDTLDPNTNPSIIDPSTPDPNTDPDTSAKDPSTAFFDEDMSAEEDEDLKPTYQPKPKPSQKPLIIGLCVAGLALAVGGGSWFYLKKQKSTEETPVISQADQALYTGSLNPPKLSLTTGENGTLYACKADVGSSDLQHSLLNTLQGTFGQVNCIMDIDGSFGKSLTGLERLASIITMIKSEPFTSVEIIGDTIYINNPKTDIVSRLVGDITLLAPQFKVLATPPLDINKTIADSIAAADKGLQALGTPPDAYALSRAMSTQIIDFNYGSAIPPINQELLTKFAKLLGASPTIKLIITTHTDTNNPDESANITLSQAQADALKNFLVQQGAKPEQLIAKGVGSTFPVSDNMTLIGKFKNRRSEFLVYDEAILSALSTVATPKQPTAPKQVDPNQMVQSAPYVPSGEYLESAPQQAQIPAPDPATTGMVQGMPSGVVDPQPVQSAPQVTASPAATYAPVPVQPSGGYVSAPSESAQAEAQFSISDGQGHSINSQNTATDTSTSTGIDPKLLNPIGTEVGRGQSNEIRQ